MRREAAISKRKGSSGRLNRAVRALAAGMSLAELIRHRGAVLSRDLLLTHVWGYDYMGDSRTVDVHVRWLREKIEVDPANPQRIATVLGIGYRFEG